MKILFYFGHPSQYLFLRNAIAILKEKKADCEILIKTKDVLEDLLIENNESYINILPEGRSSGLMGITRALIKRDLRLYKHSRNKHYDLFVGTDPCLAHIGFLKRIPVITVLEDDIHVIPALAGITFPFSSIILTPRECHTGIFEKKTIHYDGYMKLAYLHPSHFSRQTVKIRQPYFLLRASKLDAYHDSGISGFTLSIIKRIINILQEKGSVYISSEGRLDDSLTPYELKINPSQMQQVLANATMLISDSQSMSMEAAMLGVPSIRFSDFAGRISVLESLEHKFELTYGIPARSPEKLFKKINELLEISDLAAEFEIRCRKMLQEKIDVTSFLVWFIENYPSSVNIMMKNPDYQEIYKQKVGDVMG
jgi:uncharacterized protein